METIATLLLCAWYIAISAILINFNKCLMSPGHFPFAAPMMVVQMSVTLISCLCLYIVQPSFYPSMERATGNMHLILKYFPMM